MLTWPTRLISSQGRKGDESGLGGNQMGSRGQDGQDRRASTYSNHGSSLVPCTPAQSGPSFLSRPFQTASYPRLIVSATPAATAREQKLSPSRGKPTPLTEIPRFPTTCVCATTGTRHCDRPCLGTRAC
ncbi:hypothetical protein HYQ44_002484 [Verticillium longisporum]|nr:hypothetical protein HYQ44_002484 [Verticillium longisporum]